MKRIQEIVIWRGSIRVSATGGPSIFTALTEQLGLRLESQRGPVPVYLIEEPGDN
jgi:uncharacterized protein (TIGR03435 family)